MRAPTEKQYRRLLILGDGAMVLAGGKRDWVPLMRRGWVAAEKEPNPDDRYLPGLRITPMGLRALAEGVEKYGLPDLGPRPERPEPPLVQQLRDARDTARAERDQAQRNLRAAERRIERAQHALEPA